MLDVNGGWGATSVACGNQRGAPPFIYAFTLAILPEQQSRVVLFFFSEYDFVVKELHEYKSMGILSCALRISV